MALSTLQKRILSAVVLGPMTLGIIIFGGIPFIILIAIGAVISLYEWIQMARCTPRPFLKSGIGVVYILVCAAAFIFLRLFAAKDEFTNDGDGLVLSLMVCVWASDIGAYFTGKKIGGPKLAPKISPNKTWAGFFGAVLSGGLMFLIALAVSGWPLKIIFCAFPFGCVFGAVGQAGDLLISMLKRQAGVKDTGTLIPGHGGLLDRIDSLLLVFPVAAAIVLVISGL